MTAAPVETPKQVERLRRIRNACRFGYAHDTDVITKPDQAHWWTTKQGVSVWLYAVAGGEVVGFGMLSERAGRTWSSTGVLPRFQRLGFGRSIMRDLILKAHGQVWGEARHDNPGAMGIHDRRWWEPVQETGETMIFKAVAA